MASMGIIPARAGFTTYTAVRGQHHGDHPRSRGVYWWLAFCVASGVGSSPLARGLRHTSNIRNMICGIIPARAGFTTNCP